MDSLGETTCDAKFSPGWGGGGNNHITGLEGPLLVRSYECQLDIFASMYPIPVVVRFCKDYTCKSHSYSTC